MTGATKTTPAGRVEAGAAVTQTPSPDGPKAGARSIAALLKEYLHRHTVYSLLPSNVADDVIDQRFPDYYETMHILERCKPSNLDEGADMLLFARHSLMLEIGVQMDRFDDDSVSPIFQVIASVESLLREAVLEEPIPGQTAGEART